MGYDKCWSVIDTYVTHPISTIYGEIRIMFSIYLALKKKSFTLTDLIRFIAYCNVTYDFNKPDNIRMLLEMAYDHMRVDVNGEFLKHGYDYIKQYNTILTYSSNSIDNMIRYGGGLSDVLTV